MRKWAIIWFALLLGASASAQLLTWSPAFIQESSTPIQITVDANFGNRGLQSHTGNVFVHIGVITTLSTSSSDWKYVPFTWGSSNAAAQCVSLGNQQWRFTINGGLRSFFNITNASERILRISILFRDGAGNLVQRNVDGSDMYIPVYESGLRVRVDQPFRQPTFAFNTLHPATRQVGDVVNITANASESSSLQISFNGTNVGTATNATTVTANPTIATSGTQTIVATATSGSTTTRDTVQFFIAPTVNVAPLPAGVVDGINYEPGDTSVTLVLFAPLKNSISVVGDFNDWTETVRHQMNRTPDGNRFWVRVTGLTPGIEYAYQYIIDGTLRVADYNTHKVLDPWNDQFIPATNYPNLKPYPTGKATGIVGILQTRRPVYNWTVTNFNKPDKRNLVQYELLVRDFIATQNWNTLVDTLNYLQRLGVNAIHVMPFNEFEGNNSWGYNPSFYFAPDKMYGTSAMLKRFIDTCHARGIAVIMDMVLNHSFGQSPMVQMYWDAANNKPATNSPWFNPDARHPFNVGYDFNHSTQATRDFVNRVVRHWLVEYKIDGFRWDLSKGFTQVNNPTDVGAWNRRDTSRINLWRRIYDTMQAIAPNSYCILEHFADNDEETELANYGMLLWGNLNHSFREAVKANNVGDGNFEWGLHTRRGWSSPHLITYMESHDEERVIFDAVQNGNNSNAGHNVRSLNVALSRFGAATAFWAVMPGPKLLWQFGELGYDLSINRCEDGTINNNCRTNPKPARWDYQQIAARAALYNVYAQMIKLRMNPRYAPTFMMSIPGSTVSHSLNGAVKWLSVNSDSLRVMVVGNFGLTSAAPNITFPTAGTWFNYLEEGTLSTTGSPQALSLAPGQVLVYTDKNARQTITTALPAVRPVALEMPVQLYPNPARSQVVIEYEMKESAQIQIQLLDMQGQLLANMFSGFRVRGVHRLIAGQEVLHKVSNGGMYLVRFVSQGKQRTEKLMINR